eukprot:m.116473 g.116473  ORF g.116473 m.116473 type:complete len:344 (+) comp15519_c0_seq1:389-1420(+)
MLEWLMQAGVASLMLKVVYDICHPRSQALCAGATTGFASDVDGADNVIGKLTKALDRMSKLRQEERQGRIRAEKQLKQAKQPSRAAKQSTPTSLQQGYWMDEVAVVESPFHDRRGTPRQPQLAPSIPGFIRFRSKFQPRDSLKGLSEYSHLWVTFVFHSNTNMHRANSSAVMACKAMVQPPALRGQKVGCFACRSPHRPNAIGLSLVKLVAVHADGIAIAGHDLLDGTPVLDVKPYLPHVEAIVDAQLPSWVERPERLSLEPAVWMPAALASLATLQPQEHGKVQSQISELLSFDIRGAKQREASSDVVNELNYNDLRIEYEMEASHAVVTNVVTRAPSIENS